MALESSVLAQGLEPPHNSEAARRMVDAVSRHGAEPAITAVVGGVPSIGMEDGDLLRFLGRDGIRKVSARDIPLAMVARADGATTVAGAMALCVIGGIEVFATGGIGGVHRDAPYDESADLVELSRSPVVVVCAGAKSILDMAATLERLETLGVPVIGFRTSEFPAFFSASSGLSLSSRCESPEDIALAWRAHRALRRKSAMLVVQPPPESTAIESSVVEAATVRALQEARKLGIRGAAVTPFLLSQIRVLTDGRSVETNLALLEANADLAARIAAALAGLST